MRAMRELIPLAGMAILAMPVEASAQATQAQSVTLDDLSRRLDAVERENAALRAEINRLLAERAATPGTAAPAKPAMAEAPAAPAVAYADRETAAPRPNDWSGGYIGIASGVDSTLFGVDQRQRFPYNGERTVRGATYGPQIGYRWQSGPAVAGLEVALRGRTDDPAVFPIGPAQNASFDINRMVQVKGQLGLSAGRFLAYGVGGIAVTRFTHPSTPDVQTFRMDPRHTNLTAPLLGAGLAYRFDSGLSYELEYDMADFSPSDVRSDANLWLRNRTVTFRLNQQF